MKTGFLYGYYFYGYIYFITKTKTGYEGYIEPPNDSPIYGMAIEHIYKTYSSVEEEITYTGYIYGKWAIGFKLQYDNEEDIEYELHEQCKDFIVDLMWEDDNMNKINTEMKRKGLTVGNIYH